MKSKINLCLLLAVILLVGCAQITPTRGAPQPSRAFPIAVGNQWVYSALDYDGFNPDKIMWTTRVITETVIAVEPLGPSERFTVQIESSAEVKLGISTVDARPLEPAATRKLFWLLAEKELWHERPDLENPTILWRSLEFAFPLALGARWYADAETARSNPNFENYTFLWNVIGQENISTPAGNFEACFVLQQTIGGTGFERWFCPGVGIVRDKNDHAGTPFGGQMLLIKYHLAK